MSILAIVLYVFFFSKSFMAKQQKREYASFLDKPIMQNWDRVLQPIGQQIQNC